VKFAVRRLPADQCRELVEEALRSRDAAHVMALCRDMAVQYYPELVAG
jgi:hypothetical protein